MDIAGEVGSHCGTNSGEEAAIHAGNLKLSARSVFAKGVRRTGRTVAVANVQTVRADIERLRDSGRNSACASKTPDQPEI